MAENGSAETEASVAPPDSARKGVVVKVIVVEDSASVVGFSWAKPNTNIVARKTEERIILIGFYLSFVGEY